MQYVDIKNPPASASLWEFCNKIVQRNKISKLSKSWHADVMYHLDFQTDTDKETNSNRPREHLLLIKTEDKERGLTFQFKLYETIMAEVWQDNGHTMCMLEGTGWYEKPYTRRFMRDALGINLTTDSRKGVTHYLMNTSEGWVLPYVGAVYAVNGWTYSPSSDLKEITFPANDRDSSHALRLRMRTFYDMLPTIEQAPLAEMARCLADPSFMNNLRAKGLRRLVNGVLKDARSQQEAPPELVQEFFDLCAGLPISYTRGMLNRAFTLTHRISHGTVL